MNYAGLFVFNLPDGPIQILKKYQKKNFEFELVRFQDTNTQWDIVDCVHTMLHYDYTVTEHQ